MTAKDFDGRTLCVKHHSRKKNEENPELLTSPTQERRFEMSRKQAREIRIEMGITPYNGYTPEVCAIAECQLMKRGSTKIRRFERW